MAPPSCEIRFDGDSQGVYHGGQTLSGTVELRLDKPKVVNDFRLVISGYAEVDWIDWKTLERKLNVSGKEELLRVESYLIPPSSDKTEISAGVHNYNFACLIPETVPTSFEGELGKIRYTVRAILGRPWKFDQTCTAAFTVIKPLDLNRHVSSLKAVHKEKITKTFCCWPCTSNPLLVEAEIPMSGYVAGQKIPITVSMENASGSSVTGIDSSLVRKVTYISQYPREKTRVVKKNLASIWTTVTGDKSASYSQELQIPSIAPTGRCSVIVIEYIIKVIIKVGGCHRCPKIKFPITIGTVPFVSSSTEATTTKPNENIGWIDEEGASPSAPMLPPSSTDIKEVSPPTYEEAVNETAININENEPNAIGSQAFIPRYPVYKFDTTSKN